MTRKILITVILLLAISLLSSHEDQLTNIVARLGSQFLPCRWPIAYTINSFDSEFGLTRKDLLDAIVEAENIWEKPISKELFVYEPNGGLKVNLIFDTRQEATLKLQKLGIAINDSRASYDSLKAKYETAQADYNKDKSVFESRTALFESHQAAYEADVERWNKGPHRSKEEYSNLNTQRDSLNVEISELKQLQGNLNAKADVVNALVTVVNRLAASLNIEAEKYNTIGAAHPGEFQEGEYVSGPSGTEINIYQFDNRAKLVRVLAHELGHALGLDHLEDSKAIMYRLNNGINAKLTSADLSALKNLCGL
ncbi:MAG: matrixin family metalloprotease [bacterium]|nr:matrixin family metalloprotease [bacterium]